MTKDGGGIPRHHATKDAGSQTASAPFKVNVPEDEEQKDGKLVKLPCPRGKDYPGLVGWLVYQWRLLHQLQINVPNELKQVGA